MIKESVIPRIAVNTLDLLFSNFRAFRREPLHSLVELARTHGDFVSFRLGTQQTFLLNHPDLIKDVLVTYSHKFTKGLVLQRAKRVLGEGLLTSEGETHKRQRRLIQPAFHKENIRAYGATMTEFAVALSVRLQAGSEIDVAQEMRDLTLTIVSKTLLGADVEKEASEVREALTMAIELLKTSFSPIDDLLFYLPLPNTLRFRRAKARLDACIYRIIHERRASRTKQGDLLSMLLIAQDTDGTEGGMSDQQLRDEALTLFLAGHETTANALTWTWYLLSMHQAVERKLHDELDRVLDTRLPTVDDLPALSYTRKVFSESLRCYPPAWVMARTALQDHNLLGYKIKTGSYLLMSPYLLHHDARYYPNPFTFDPERWSADPIKIQVPFTYLPFGAGPRICIGESFAWMEGILLIATLAQRWRMRVVPGHPVELQPLITLRPKYGMRMVLEPRQ